MSATQIQCLKAVDICQVLLDQNYVKSATVPEIKQHEDGYTEYKVLLQAIPSKSLDQDFLSYSVWRRFRDWYKLYRRVVTIHTQLHLKGVVPALPKPDYFGRKDPSVVLERRQACEQFVSYIVQNRLLCQCEVVLEFFAGAEREDFDSANCSSIIIPAQYSQLEQLRDDRDSATQSVENHSPSPSTVAEPPPAGTGLEIFDQFTDSSIDRRGNLQLLSEVMDELQASSEIESSIGECSSTTEMSERRLVSNAISNGKSVSGGESKWKSKIVDFFPKLSPSSSKHSLSGSLVSPTTGELKTVKSEGQIAGRKSTKSIESPIRNRVLSTPKFQPSIDYIVQAAEFICSAQKAEEERVFDLAFTCYKSAITLMLQGVQDEKDPERRNAVRLKTAVCLRNAEKLYKLQFSSEENVIFRLDGFSTNFLSTFDILGFQSVYADLSQYRCIDVLSKNVQLVEDTTSGEKYVVKVLYKSCYKSAYTPKRVIEQSIPTRTKSMVKLVRYWDTDTSVILLLEYAAGGRIWDRLQQHFRAMNNANSREYIKTFYSNSAILPTTTAFSIGTVDDPIDFIDHRDRHDSQDGISDCGAGRLSRPNIGDQSPFTKYEGRVRHSNDDSFSLEFTANSPNETGEKLRRFSFATALHLPKLLNVDLAQLRKWFAQLILGVGALHIEGLICRDLNPNNLLLNNRNDLVLTFFCEWAGVDRPFNENMAKSLYSAPEINGIADEVVTEAADWWSVGCIFYEMVTGKPLSSQCPYGVATHSTIPFPDDLPIEVKDLVTRLVRYDAEDRLGSCFGGVDEIKMHPFFMDFEWSTVE